MITVGKRAICEENEGHGCEGPQNVTPCQSIFEAGYFTAPPLALVPLLPLGEFLVFNPVRLGEIAPTQLCIQCGSSLARKVMSLRCQVQKLVITPLGVLG